MTTTIDINGTLTLDQSSGSQGDDTAITSDLTGLSTTFKNFLNGLTGDLQLSAGQLSFADDVEAAVSGAGFVTVNPDGATISKLFFSDSSGNAFDGDQVIYNGSPLQTVDGDNIYLHSYANGTIVLATTSATEGAGDVVAAFYLNAAGDNLSASIEMVTFEAIAHPDSTNSNDSIDWTNLLNVSSTGSLSFNFDGLASGNNLFVAVGSSGAGMVVSGIHPVIHADGTLDNSGDNIKTSQGGIGATIGVNNQMFDPGETAVFSFVKGQAPGTYNDLDNMSYTDFIDVTDATLFISQTEGSPGTNFTVKIGAFSAGGASTNPESGRSYLDNDLNSGANLGNDANQSALTDDTKVAIVRVVIRDGNGQIVTNTTVNDNYVTFNADGTITAQHLNDSYTVQWFTDNTGTQTLETFNRFQATAVVGKFDVGRVDLSQGVTVTESVGDKLVTNDDGPTVSTNAAVQLDDDALTGGNAGGTGDVNPDTANTTGTLAHSYGADGAGSTLLTGAGLPTSSTTEGAFIQTVNGAGTLLTISQIQNGVAVAVVSVSLSNTTAGAYTVTQLHAIDHPAGLDENDVSFTIGYTTTDHDGDTAAGSMSINVDDDTPTVSTNAAVQLDDDALTGGNAGGTGDVNPDTANTTGTLAHSYGADGAGSTLLTGAGLPTSSTTEGAFIQTVNGAGTLLTISQIQNGVAVAVVSVSLSNTTAGAYTVTQLHAIDHPAGLDENDVSFTIGYTTTDHDGDTAAGSMSINVDDDTPTVSTNAAVQLDDDALTGGNAGGTGDVNPDTANTTGTLAHSYGADGAGSTLLTGAGLPTSSTTEGAFIQTVNGAGTLLTISQIQNGVAVAVVSVSLSNTTAGAYTVTQLHAIDHPAGLDENDVSFTIGYTTTDHDGDTAAGSMSINVDDDTPTVSTNAAVQLDDDALTGGNAGGTGDVNPDTANTTGTLAHSYGADGAGSTLLTGAGLPTSSTTEGDFIQAVNGAGTLLTISQIQNGVAVAVVSVSLSNTTAGAYTVTQLHAIDHPAGLNENDVSFTIGYTTTDHDGDTAAGSLAINVDDDTPTVSTNAAVQLDDDALTGGNAGGTGDVNPDTANTTGTLAHSYGADGAGSTLLTGAGLPTSSTTEGDFIQAVNGAGTLLTISQIQNGVAVAVVSVSLSNTTAGAYTVTQLHAIDHPAGLNENDVSFTIGYTTTDHDGDTAAGSLAINVDDDTPTVSTNAAVQLDDDALTGGNAGGTGDVNPDTANTTGTLAHSYGADGAGSTLLTGAGLPTSSTTEGDFIQAVNGAGTLLTISQIQNGVAVAVVSVSLSNTTAGAYTVTQLHAIDHPAGLDENNVSFTIGYTTTDHDGDTAAGSMSINVDDDTPTITKPFDGDQNAGNGTGTHETLINIAGQQATGDFGYSIGSDRFAAYDVTHSDFVDQDSVSAGNQLSLTGYLTGLVPNTQTQLISSSATLQSESATSATFNWQISYDSDPNTAGDQTATAGGTLVFNKAAGTYTITLNDAADGFSFDVLHTAELVAKQPTSNTGHPPIVLETLVADDPSTQAHDGFYVQFTGNLIDKTHPFSVTSDGEGSSTDTSFNSGLPTPGTHDMISNSNETWVSATQSTNGVAGDTIQKGELLTLRFFDSNVGIQTEATDPTATASAVALKFDGIGSSEDLMLILDLTDGTNEITRAVYVSNSDIYRMGQVPSPYNGEFTLDNNDGLVIIEQNDYNAAGEHYVIQGIQIMQSGNGITGQAIDLNGTTGTSSGGSNATTSLVAFDPVDNDVLKITDIGFVSTQTTTPDAHLDFGVQLHDADGDTTTVQHILVDIA